MAKPSKREVELERGIVGMAGYLRWALANGLSVEAMLETLAHDIGGLARMEECFCPRTDSYRKYLFAREAELRS